MTNEKMLENLLALRNINETDQLDALLLLNRMVEELQEDIRADCMKKKGLQKRDKLIQKIMDELNTEFSRERGRYGYHDCAGGPYGFCGGFRIYATTDTYGHPKAPQQMEPDKLLPKRGTTSAQVDLADVQLFIKKQKAEKAAARKAKKVFKPAPYILEYAEGKRVGFNAEYLLDFRQFFNTPEVGIYDQLTGCTYCDPETGEWGWLLPCRITESAV